MRNKNHPANLLANKKRTLLTAVAIGAALTLSATVTQAGFQWVPPTGQEQPGAATGAVPPAEAAPTQSVDEMVLPLPGEPVPAADAAALSAAPEQTLQLPADYEAQPLPPQQQQPVLRVRQVAPTAAAEIAAPAPAQIPLPPAQTAAQSMEQDYQQNYNEPVLLAAPQTPSQPVVNAAPAPVYQPQAEAHVTRTKVIMPEDAPQTAMDNTPNSEKLTINPYPGTDGTPITPVQPAPQISTGVAPAQQGNFALVEGFGSDMPLALALQQVAPPEYAFSFGESVNPGQKVSWDGGKPWNQVISEMVAPFNLEAVISDRVVHIKHAGEQRQGALNNNPAVDDGAELRRGNIQDPGEQTQRQAMNALAGIETASGTPGEAIAEATAPEASTNEQVEIPVTEETALLDDNAAPAHEEDALDTNSEAKQQDEQLAAQTSTGNAAAVSQWQAKTGESLKEALTRWSRQAGVELIWMASYDYKVQQDILISSDIANAVQTIVSSGIDRKSAPQVSIVNGTGSKTPGAIIVKDKA